MKDVRTAHDLAWSVVRGHGGGPDAGAIATRALVRRMFEAAKFAEIGVLATGIIHEINNPIACISSNVALLLEELPRLADPALGFRGKRIASRWISGSAGVGAAPNVLASDLAEILDDLAASVDLVASIARNLKSLAYSAHDDPKETDLHECIEAALRVAGHELRYRVRIEKDLGAVPQLVAYPGLLIQLFLNLFVNAAQAIDGEGTLRIRTRCDGTGAVIEVADTGRGVARENLRRMFCPFFTTKPAGKGLGLGLSICKGIVDRHGGDIRVSSSSEEGTVFRIKLPLRVGRAGSRIACTPCLSSHSFGISSVAMGTVAFA